MFKITQDTGNTTVFNHLKGLEHNISTAIRKGAYISGKELVADLRADMKKPKSGRKYKIYEGVTGALKKPRLHTASSPDETPAIRTGKFRKSIGFKVLGSSTLEFGSGEDGLAQYAKALEEGTSKMKPREPLGRTVKKFGNKVKTNIDKEIKKEICKV